MNDILDMRGNRQAPRNRRGVSWYVFAPFLIMLVLLALWGPFLIREATLYLSQYTQTRYAFYLKDGEIVYAQIRGVGWSEFILSDAYLFQAVTVGDTSTNNLIAQRDNPLTKPADWMVVSRSHIVFYEQVGAGAPVMRAIEQLR